MSSIKERQRACEETLLTALRNELAERGVHAVFLIEDDGRSGVEVLDVAGRARRVYVHLEFRWFYWGDQPDERISCLQLQAGVERIQQAAQDGWRREEQGELSFNLRQLAEAYRL
ncbi:hypothetical protein SAMN05444920_103882 [Nonomuraea solani]|uniref:Uncharacterized protein n=1 Tax=Nonomuraea solani TaxID=1144553 RepID=A0A1H6C3M2_9ACTN|nr:hypothetical protein [Nonomuraea solani]SEG67564.1 hypothetical protein SAMN05444920_103882 [Nonomuraea solani]